MLKVMFDGTTGPLQVLCVGCHSDDIEIGCGGSVLRLLSEPRPVEVTWLVLAGGGSRKVEAEKCARGFLRGADSSDILIEDFRDGFFPYDGAAIKTYFERLKETVSPDLVFTHQRDDLHQDHRLVSELTWNTFRDHLILEYEIIKYDGDIGVPNFFVHLSEETVQSKVDLLLEHHASQAGKDWFDEETFRAIMRLRGVESRAPQRYAEAFYARKVTC